MTSWRGAVLVAGAIGALLCVAVFRPAGAQPTPDAGADACQKRVQQLETALLDQQGAFDTTIKGCQKEGAALKAESADAKAQLKAALEDRRTDADTLAKLAAVLKRLRPEAEEQADPAKALAAIDSDVKGLLEERDTLQATVAALQKQIDDFRERIGDIEERQARNLDKLLGQPCALLARRTTSEGLHIEGLLPGGAAAKERLRRDLERVVSGPAPDISGVEAVEGNLCLMRLDEQWVLARQDADLEAPLEVEVGKAVTGLLSRLPSDTVACERAFTSLYKAEDKLRGLLPGPDDDVDVWLNNRGALNVCRSAPSRDPPWQRLGGIGEGRAGLLIIEAPAPRGAAPPSAEQPEAGAVPVPRPARRPRKAPKAPRDPDGSE